MAKPNPISLRQKAFDLMRKIGYNGSFSIAELMATFERTYVGESVRRKTMENYASLYRRALKGNPFASNHKIDTSPVAPEEVIPLTEPPPKKIANPTFTSTNSYKEVKLRHEVKTCRESNERKHKRCSGLFYPLWSGQQVCPYCLHANHRHELPNYYVNNIEARRKKHFPKTAIEFTWGY